MDAMELVWKHTINEVLGREYLDSLDEDENLIQHPVLLTESPFNINPIRTKTAEVMFESFEAPSVYFANSALLSLFSHGKTTGVVVDSGEYVTHIVPVNEGITVKNAISSIGIGGYNMTTCLEVFLKRDRHFGISRDILEQIKHKVCYVNYPPSQMSGANITYTLPDGKEITIGSARYYCTEALFTPAIAGIESKGIPDALNSSINICDQFYSNAATLLQNIELIGGNTMFPNFRSRMEKEMTEYARPGITPVVSSYGKDAAFKGGSILSEMPTFKEMFPCKADWYEYGAQILDKKCFT